MVEPLRHRQTKGAETDMSDLQQPRHIPTLPKASFGRAACRFRFYPEKQTGWRPVGTSHSAQFQPRASPSSCARCRYMRDLPRERAECQQIGVDGGGSKIAI